jgi:hypothetical protein
MFVAERDIEAEDPYPSLQHVRTSASGTSTLSFSINIRRELNQRLLILANPKLQFSVAHSGDLISDKYEGRPQTHECGSMAKSTPYE